MITRRKFLRNSAISAAFLQNTQLFASENQKKAKPIVIATWNNHKACKAAWEVIKNGGVALDAIETGLKVPEADPEDTSVGYGGMPDRDGNVTLDACIMDEKGRAGSVTFLQHIMHPISVARKVMEETPHVMISGEGALQFALAQGFQKENLLTENAKKAWLDWIEKNRYTPIISPTQHDTCGMLSIDQHSNLSGGCTTSGWAFKMHGRIGDSPVIGAGLFVDNEVGGATGTGQGELALRTLGSFLVVEQMRCGKSPQKACEIACRRIVDKYGDKDQMCYIAVDKNGNHGAFSIKKGFEYYIITEDGPLLCKAECFEK
jgi:N4-(beta-N-acetylglucosaminyl)-L-asparaginase